MPISFPNQSLLQGLSSFWLSFYKETDSVESAYRGNIHLLGQVYFDLLESVLGRSLEEAPIYSKKNWQLFSFDESQLTYTPEGEFNYEIELPFDLQVVDFGLLLNKVLDPTVMLEAGRDFTVLASQVRRTKDFRSVIRFEENPFRSGTDGTPIDGVPAVNVELSEVEYKSGELGATDSVLLTLSDDEASFDPLDVHRELEILSGPNEGRYSIVSVDSPTIVTLGAAALTDDTEAQWRVVSPARGWQVTFWAPDVVVDKKTLAEQFGVLVNRFEPSSESYKQLLRGVFNYFANGPDVARLNAALNVVIGLPIVREGEELLVSFEEDAENDLDIITTDKHVYELPITKARDDIRDPAAWGVLTLRAFEALSNRFEVMDNISRPGWWHGFVVPAQFAPNESRARRFAGPDLGEVYIGNTEFGFRVGDLGFRIGADSDGFVVAGPWATRLPLANRHAYLLTDIFLKHHLIGITVDDETDLPRPVEDLEAIINAGRPAHCFVVFRPEVQREAGVEVADETSLALAALMSEDLERRDTRLHIGTPGFEVGQYFFYTYAPDEITIASGVPDRTLGQNPLAIGGTSPFDIPGVNGPDADATTDWPVSVTITIV